MFEYITPFLKKKIYSPLYVATIALNISDFEVKYTTDFKLVIKDYLSKPTNYLSPFDYTVEKITLHSFSDSKRK